MTTYLYYVNSTQEPVNGGTHTRINLKDDKYPVNVTLNYVAYPKENVIKTWTEISHREKKPVTLSQYASAMLYFNEPQYWLTENPDVAYFKWDCNSPITNIYSPYAKDKQGQLYVESCPWDILCAETHQGQVSRCADDALFGGNQSYARN